MVSARKIIIGLVAVVLVFGLNLASFSQDLETFEVEAPVAITTCGQSPGALMAKLIFSRANIEVYHDDLLTVEFLQERAAQGEGFKTLVITTGTSMKGMGAAGTDIYVEIERIEKLISEAKKQGMVLIGAHIEGAARRVDHTDAQSIEVVCTKADLLMVIESSDEDGYFTKLAQERGVPLLKAEEALHLAEPLQRLFNK